MADRPILPNPFKRWSTWITAFGEVLIATGISSLIVIRLPLARLAFGLLIYILFSVGIILVFQTLFTVRSLLGKKGSNPERGWQLMRVGGHLLTVTYGLALGLGLSGTVPPDVGEASLATGLALLVVMWFRAVWKDRPRAG